MSEDLETRQRVAALRKWLDLVEADGKVRQDNNTKLLSQHFFGEGGDPNRGRELADILFKLTPPATNAGLYVDVSYDRFGEVTEDPALVVRTESVPVVGTDVAGAQSSYVGLDLVGLVKIIYDLKQTVEESRVIPEPPGGFDPVLTRLLPAASVMEDYTGYPSDHPDWDTFTTLEQLRTDPVWRAMHVDPATGLPYTEFVLPQVERAAYAWSDAGYVAPPPDPLPDIPFIQSGTESIMCGTGVTVGQATGLFPAAFSGIPDLTVTPMTTAGSQWACGIISVSPTGFVAQFSKNGVLVDTQLADFQWIAHGIQP